MADRSSGQGAQGSQAYVAGQQYAQQFAQHYAAQPLSQPNVPPEAMRSFWAQQMAEVEQQKTADAGEFRNQQLPLARIKKIMKSDEDVRMISAEAPVLFAKACEMFILELTLRAWNHAEENKRRTLQRSDVAGAITRTEIFDFLVDIVPRDEVKQEGEAMSSAVGPNLTGPVPGSRVAPMAGMPGTGAPISASPPSQMYFPFPAPQGMPVDPAAFQQQQQQFLNSLQQQQLQQPGQGWPGVPRGMMPQGAVKQQPPDK